MRASSRPTATRCTTLRSAFSDAADPHEIGREVAARWGDAVLRALELRDRGGLSAERFIDVDYRDIVHEPLAVIRKIYAYFGRELDAGAERAMGDFLAAHPKDKHGAHEYSLEQFGLDRGEQARRFAGYRARFGC